MVKRLEEGGTPEGVAVFDFGSGGLDLAYEVMRGYDALVMVDVSQQGGEPGTLYVMEPDPDEIDGGIEDGEMIDPHGMDPLDRAAVREGRGRLARQGGGRGLRARERGGDGHGPHATRWSARWSGAVKVVLEHRRGDEEQVHELSLSSAILETVLKHADGRRVNTVELTVGALRQVVPASLEFYWGSWSAATRSARARDWSRSSSQARLRCNACGVEWGLDAPDFRCAGCEGTDVEVLSGTEFLVESIDVEDRETEACTAPR